MRSRLLHAMSAIVLTPLLVLSAACAADSAVRVELVIPPAETHVIGDPIPLFFRFQNQSTEPLGFMWEGCCRFNGKLAVTKAGAVIPPTPPGQALAHMFAKAERLDPGQPKDFDTRLSDWVILRESGAYELRGRYQGVLDFQRPQVGRGLSLWRGAAETPPLQLAVLNVADYLAQREARSQKRGVRIEISGPTKLAPLVPSPLRVRFTNTSTTTQKFHWPESVQLWVVNTNGVRVPAASVVDGISEELTLNPGATLEREIPFSSDKLEGEPWGDYRVFADLAESPGAPRVPSAAITLRWELTKPEVVDLLTQAATGHRTGARNAPLKLLRVYLAEIERSLDAALAEKLLSAPAAQKLGVELLTAACLKPFGPKPGLVELELNPGGSFKDDAVTRCLARLLGPNSNSVAAQLPALISVRRHLGWEIGLSLTPSTSTPLSAITATAADLRGYTDLAHPPRTVLKGANGATNIIEYVAEPTPANFVLRMTMSGVRNQLSFVRRLPDPQTAGRGLISPAELSAVKFEPLADAHALEAALNDGRLSSLKILLLVENSVKWGDLLAALEPILPRGISMDLAPLK